MEKIAGFPFFPLEITKNGSIFSPGQRLAISTALDADGADQITDLFVVSHGWNNDMGDARALYENLFSNVDYLLAGPRSADAAGRKAAIVGVFWPSKKFADEELIPAGGAAGMGAAAADGRLLPAKALQEKLERLKGTFDHPDSEALEKAKALVGKLEDSPAARNDFVDLVRSVLPQPRDTGDDASDLFFKKSGDELLTALRAPVRQKPSRGPGQGGVASVGTPGPTGGAAGLGDLFGGMKAAASRLLNYTTYYQMKERAGVVGAGLNEVLATGRAARSALRIHLIGHSFGARVVTAAADGPKSFGPVSMTLLQAAFSHNAFTENVDGPKDGFFRKVISQNKVAGPIVVTHTANDQAVGVAYALASRLAGDNRAGLGDENDPFGGLGRNGAVKMKPGECIKGVLLGDDGCYKFEKGKVHNLRADQHISNHGDVTTRPVANVVLAAAGM